MPAYPGSDLAVLLYENRQALLWNNELVPVASLSAAVQLRRERGASYPFGFSVEVAFSATPGTFEVDVMVADTDQASHYISAGSITAVNASFVGRLDVVNVWAKYVALLNKTAPNAATVRVTGQVTR